MNGHNGHSANFTDSDGIGSVHDYERGRGGGGSRRRSQASRGSIAPDPAPKENPGFSMDAGSLLRPASKRWYWLLLGAMLGTAAGAVLAMKLWTTGYKVTSQIYRFDAPLASDAYRPPMIRGETLVGMLKSPAVMQRTAELLKKPVNQMGTIVPQPERMSDIVNILAVAADAQGAVDLANAYNTAIIEFTQENQRTEAIEADKNVQQMLKEAEEDLAKARKALPAGALASVLASGTTATPVNISARRIEQIQNAEDELQKLLVQYTELHPAVKRQRHTVATLKAGIPEGALEKVLAGGAIGPDGKRDGTALVGGTSREEAEIAFYNLRVYEQLRQQLVAKQRAIQLFVANPPGNWRVMTKASLDNVQAQKPWLKVALVAAFCGMLGLVVAGGEVLRREIFDNRLKTEGDVARVTGLPVLATLGDIRRLSLADREAWAFRTWIALQDRLAYSPNHGLICGFTSSSSGDGRTTWLNLLAGAARKCGFRVLTIATRANADAPPIIEDMAEPVPEPAMAGVGVDAHEHANGSAGLNGSAKMNGHAATAGGGTNTRILAHPNDLIGARNFSSESEYTALTASALFTPAVVTEKLMGPETDPLVHIPLPGWTWNLERRKQWAGALNVWRKIDNVVILVELPPASMPESVLLASNLPNLVWLVESGKSEATETRNQLETLRHARCNLVGAVINRAMTPVAQGRFSRWVGCFAMFALLGLFTPGLVAADAPAAPAPAATVAAAPTGSVAPAVAAASFSIVSPNQRADWQKKLTLGPGDVLSFNLYGDPELTLQEVPIGPDGRVGFLEAQGIMAAGLTVDEFRERLNEELAKYRRSAQAFVVPVAYKSRKYYVLGKVAQRGSFPLDRPVTLLEAVARAGGMETGLATDRSLVELADLSRSFVARGGKRLSVDFQKLFMEGDLTQNIALEPDDYVYLPGGGEKEVFVLGAVRTPGSHTYGTSVGAVGAIAGRGGFTDRAWTKRILVVRGGLGRSETFIVNAYQVLSGRQPDVPLQPKDIVYVSDRPWIYAEELLDAAANAFVTAAVVTWTGEKITRD